MCDPISIIGLGLSIGMAVMNYENQQDMVDKQNQANDAWVAYQQRQSKDYLARDEELRKQADAARETSLSELTPDKQQNAQKNEQARLQDVLMPEQLKALAEGDKASLNDELISGQHGASGQTQSAIEGAIQQAAIESRKRIAALAAVQSYGGSQFGLTQRANQIFNASGQDIRMSGDMRQGGLAAYNVAKAVEPIKIVQQGGGSAAGPLANAASSFSGNRLGTQLASSMFSG
jgi:hypothetical protein